MIVKIEEMPRTVFKPKEVTVTLETKEEARAFRHMVDSCCPAQSFCEYHIEISKLQKSILAAIEKWISP